jgi:hypothetical protein
MQRGGSWIAAIFSWAIDFEALTTLRPETVFSIGNCVLYIME